MWLEKDGESMKGVRSLSSAICLVERARRSCWGVGDRSQQWEGCLPPEVCPFRCSKGSGWIFKQTFQILVLLLSFAGVPGSSEAAF